MLAAENKMDTYTRVNKGPCNDSNEYYSNYTATDNSNNDRCVQFKPWRKSWTFGCLYRNYRVNYNAQRKPIIFYEKSMK